MPTEGDSLDYHIPIAQNILHGKFLGIASQNVPMLFYPAVSESILSVFIFLKIPLNLYNVVSVVVLFFTVKKLGNVFGLSYNFAIIFASTICTLGTVVRWMNAQTIDIWLAIFFTWLLILLEQKKKDIFHFFKIGIAFGMLIGTKYTGVLFGSVVTFFYIKDILKNISFKKALVFFVPFSAIGLIWYARNYYETANPFYPMYVLFFKGKLAFPDRVWNVFLRYPIEQTSAFIAEYRMWIFSLFVTPIVLVKKWRVIENREKKNILKLFLIGIVNFAIFTTFISSYQVWIMVSVMRYAYASFIPLILCVFLLGKIWNKEEDVAFFAIANMVMVNTFAYLPKLLFILIPVAFVVFKIVDLKSD